MKDRSKKFYISMKKGPIFAFARQKKIAVQSDEENLTHSIIPVDMSIGIGLNDFLYFRIEFMYEAHHMMISYRPEVGGIWNCYGISHGL
jgi:hypothetical protein